MTPRVHCAIYTRKSSEEGLEQAFNSLDAQREAGLAFIQSQRHEGWRAISTHDDDGGFSGGNMDRPALKRLMADSLNNPQSPGDKRAPHTASLTPTKHMAGFDRLGHIER